MKKKRTWKKMSPEEVERQLENQRRFAEALVRMLERQGVSHEEAVRRAMAHD